MSTIPDADPVVATTPAPLKLIVVTSLLTVIPSSDTVTGEPPPPLPESNVIVKSSKPFKVEALTSVTALPVNWI